MTTQTLEPTHYRADRDMVTACGMSVVDRFRWLTAFWELVTCADCLGMRQG